MAEAAGRVPLVGASRTRRAFLSGSIGVLSLGSLALLSCGASPTLPLEPKRYRVAFLFTRLYEPAVQNHIANISKRLRDLGYDWSRVTYHAFNADGDAARFPALAADAVSVEPDVIVCMNPQAASALMRATSTIPILFWGTGTDVVSAGLTSNISKPERNLTGLTTSAALIHGKRIQLLKDVAPKITRVAVISDVAEPKQGMEEMERVGRSVGVEILPCYIRNATELEAALAAAVDGKADALTSTAAYVIGTSAGQPRAAEFALARGWPSINVPPQFGGLMNYNLAFVDESGRMANFVHRVLQGIPVAQLPFEGPSGVTCVINHCTAAKLGLTFPPSIVAMATDQLRNC
jgi:putative tryptophan/tyrosine transport system substrate-binding protein